jgi:actin-like ATPase involved in cell morphogenesis
MKNIKTIRPWKDGVIADFVSEKMSRDQSATCRPALKMVVCIPSKLK